MILLYHKVFPESPTMWWVRVDEFYRQMCELKCRKVVYLDDYNPGDPEQVVITFDGIYRNVLHFAAPILKEFSYPFELFITGIYAGKDNSFDTQEPNTHFASIEELSELVGMGGRLQWHSSTHRHLFSIKEREEIEEELSVPDHLRKIDEKGFRWFAYPNGDFNKIAYEEVRKRFRGAVSCHQGNDWDIYKLNRITVTNDTSFKKGMITVIIASYNYGHFLIEAVESVLRQTRPVDEIIISDDCSTDHTMEIAQEYQRNYPKLIKCNRNEKNLGIAAHFNKAISLTSADYVCFLGADNRLRSDYLEKTAEILDSDERIGIAYTDFAFFGWRAKIEYEMFNTQWRGPVKGEFFYVINFPDFTEETKKLLEKHNFMHGSSLFRRKAFYDAGGFLEERNVPEDHNLFLRIVKKGWLAKRAPYPILEYRQHSVEQANLRLRSFAELCFYRERGKNLEARIGDLQSTLNEREVHIENLQATLKEKDTHIRNLERQREENYRDWQAHTKNLELIINERETHIGNLETAVRDKDTHIRNLERQQEENYRDWQAHTKNLELAIKNKETHIGNLEASLINKDRQIGNLEASLKEKDTYIKNLERQREEDYWDWQTHTKNLKFVIKDKDHHIGNLEATVRDRDSHISNLEAEIRDKGTQIGNFETTMKERETYISTLEYTLKERESQIGDLENTVKEKHATLNWIYNSYGIGALLVCNKMIDNIFPLKSRRRLFAKIILNGIKDPKAILKNLSKKNIKFFIHSAKNTEPAILEERAETLIFQQAILMYCDKAILGPGNIEVAGWAISTHGIDRVEVYCKDNLLGHASCGSLRPDVQAVYPFIKNSDKSGFTFYADFVRIQPSPEKYPILVRAIAKDGKIGEIELFLDEPDLYKNYLERTTPNEGTLHWMREISVRLSVKPSISLVLIAKEETLPFLACSLDSVMAQTYPFWNILLFCEKELPVDILQKIHPLMDEDKLKCYPLSDRGVSLNMIQGDFLGFIRSGDILAPHALFEMVKKINVDGPLDLIYTDEDTLIDGHRKDFFFKPDWSPDLLFSMNYIGQFFLLSRECFIQAGGFHHEFSSEAIYDLLFRVTEHTQIIGHVPLVLYTKNSDIENFPQGEKKVIEESLSRQGYRGEVIPLTEKGTSWRVRREIIGNPKVSIIILTAYKKPDLFRNCLRSIIEKSTYSNYEIILIDHSFGKLSQKDLEQLFPVTAFKVIKYNGNFNFSHMNNLGAENASGDYLILLNDDTEVITPGWIEAMLEHAQQSHIGVVGIKLFYPDEAIQHGGVFLADTGGGARHAFRFFLRDSDGYCGFLKTVRNCSAVTFACVMIPKKVYLELKGLDENLRVECNDVDFCLRANEAGYRVVWTPFALLYHRELATREKINFKDDTSFFWNRWQHLLEKGDPYYNSSLTLDSDDFSLNPRPVIIEHHEPYLPSGFKVRYHKNSVVDPESIRRILAVKLDHIGDVILSLPAIKMLQTRFPKAHITMLIGKWAKPIVEKFSQIDDILTFDFFFEESEKGKRKLTTKEMKHLGNMLQSHNFDLAIDLRRHHETREILKLSGARYLAGYCTGGDDDWLTMSLELSEEIQDIATQSNKLHITAQLCQLVQALTTKHPSTEPPIMSIPKLTLEKELPSVERYSHLLQAKFLVGIHPGAGGPLKQWPIPYFSRLADLLIERFDAQVVLFGGKKEKQPVSQIFSQMKHKGKAVSLAGETSLEEFMAAVRYCHLFIGNDSGPCHIAGILDVPTLAIFSGEVLPHEWHPLGEKTLSIRLDVPCSPCYKAYVEQCPFDLKCMKFLWPEKVYKGSQQLLGSL